MQTARLSPPPLFDFGAPAPKPEPVAVPPAPVGTLPGYHFYDLANDIWLELDAATSLEGVEDVRDRHASTLAAMAAERPGIARPLSRRFAERRDELKPEWEA
jgi:hypothetical protein